MPGLDWKRLRKLQCPDGSYMSSPAPTAYALMQTGDAKCFEFLDKLIDKFNGGGMDRRAHKMLTRNYTSRVLFTHDIFKLALSSCMNEKNEESNKKDNCIPPTYIIYGSLYPFRHIS